MLLVRAVCFYAGDSIFRFMAHLLRKYVIAPTVLDKIPFVRRCGVAVVRKDEKMGFFLAILRLLRGIFI